MAIININVKSVNESIAKSKGDINNYKSDITDLVNEYRKVDTAWNDINTQAFIKYVNTDYRAFIEHINCLEKKIDFISEYIISLTNLIKNNINTQSVFNIYIDSDGLNQVIETLNEADRCFYICINIISNMSVPDDFANKNNINIIYNNCVLYRKIISSLNQRIYNINSQYLKLLQEFNRQTSRLDSVTINSKVIDNIYTTIDVPKTVKKGVTVSDNTNVVTNRSNSFIGKNNAGINIENDDKPIKATTQFQSEENNNTEINKKDFRGINQSNFMAGYQTNINNEATKYGLSSRRNFSVDKMSSIENEKKQLGASTKSTFEVIDDSTINNRGDNIVIPSSGNNESDEFGGVTVNSTAMNSFNDEVIFDDDSKLDGSIGMKQNIDDSFVPEFGIDNRQVTINSNDYQDVDTVTFDTQFGNISTSSNDYDLPDNKQSSDSINNNIAVRGYERSENSNTAKMGTTNTSINVTRGHSVDSNTLNNSFTPNSYNIGI